MDNTRYLSIGEVSRLKNVTIKALRYYHDIGLLIPAYINPDNGYRYYTIDQFIYLDIIKFCKQSNVGVKEIKTLFANGDNNYLKLYLERKKEEIHNEIKRLNQLNKQLETLQTAIHSSEEELLNDGFLIQSFEERHLLSLPTQSGELNEIKSFDKLDESLSESAIQTFQYGLIYSHQLEQWEISDVFRLITSDDYEVHKDFSNVHNLPEGEYLTINCTRETEIETYQLVRKYMKTHCLKDNKVYMFYLVTDVFNQDSHYSQFQIKLKSTF